MRLQIGYQIETIPNLHGFKFRGVTHNGDLIDCVVICGDDGIHRIHTDDDKRNSAFSLLRGWMQHLPVKATATN